MARYDSSKLIQHLNTKWQNRPCPLCGARQWNVQDKIFELREFHGGNLVLGAGPIIPVIPVICTNCGNTVLVNPLVAGITVEGSDKENE